MFIIIFNNFIYKLNKIVMLIFELENISFYKKWIFVFYFINHKNTMSF